MSLVRSVRFRVTAIAVVAVLVVLVAGGVTVVLLQRAALTANVDQALAQRADDIGALVETGTVPDFLPRAEEGFAQLVATDGTVLASTPNLVGFPAVPIDTDESTTGVQVVSGLEFDDDTFRVLTRPVPGVGVLHVGVDDELISESTAALATALLVTIPILVLVLAGVVWLLVGRTLQPVEDMREEVSAIGSTDLHRRVPQPGTGDEIDRLASTMNAMLRRLESSAERQQRFVSDASHELRGPLTRMRALLEVELAADRTGSWASYQSLLDDVVDMQGTVENLLYLARADEDAIRIDLRPLDLDDVVLREAHRIQSHGSIDVDLSGVSGAHVLGDPGQLARSIRNLLDNAERHAESRIWLRLEEDGDRAVLRVADDGPGIAPEDAERIFERFSRLDDARAAGTGGTGLGLAIARDIAQRHNGSLDLVPSSDGGASFELSVPLADPS